MIFSKRVIGILDFGFWIYRSSLGILGAPASCWRVWATQPFAGRDAGAPSGRCSPHSVFRIPHSTLPSPHDQSAAGAVFLRCETGAQIFDDLIVERLAMWTPALGFGEPFHTGAQTLESQNEGRAIELAVDGISQAREEQEFAILNGFICEILKVRVDHTASRSGWG